MQRCLLKNRKIYERGLQVQQRTPRQTMSARFSVFPSLNVFLSSTLWVLSALCLIQPVVLGSSKGFFRKTTGWAVAGQLRTSLTSTQLFISVTIWHCRRTVTGRFFVCFFYCRYRTAGMFGAWARMAKAFQVNIAAKMLHCSVWREWFTHVFLLI